MPKRKAGVREKDGSPSATRDAVVAKLVKQVRKLPFRFLDLPGEIRNRIYHTALYSNAEFSVSIHYRPEMTARLRTRRRHQTKTNMAVLSVSQVCNTIRKEFRPLWFVYTYITVLDDECDLFFNTFLRYGDPKAAVANIDIDSRSGYRRSMNILPWFHLVAKSPRFLVSLAEPIFDKLRAGWKHIVKLMGMIVDEPSCLASRLSRVLVRFDVDHSKLVPAILVKPEHAEIWMEPWAEDSDVRRWNIERQEQYLSDHGLNSFVGPSLYIDGGSTWCKR